ncbi:MAG: MFS transporter [Acutalibacteraceae bacterium]|nr:MFS transporter [Acutalibacteraceae bacterium]
MATLLLIIIYIAFIGLGVPDSLIGSAWPAIHTELSIPVEMVSILTFLISGCTVLSSMFSTRILNKLGTAKVTAFSTTMTALSLLGFSLVPSFLFMIPLAIVLGLGAGAIDSGLNNFVALHCKASHMNFLHCFYGVGVSLSPYIMSQAFINAGWRGGYRYAFYVQFAIALILIFSIPLWKKSSSTEETDEESGTTLSIAEMIKKSEVRKVWVIMLITNAIEYACGVWGSTYLVEEKGFKIEHGALALTIYYVGMSIGRFASGLLANKIKTWKRIFIGCVILAPAIVIMLLPLGDIFAVVGLFLIGLGNGSIYPNFIHLTPHNFGKEVSQSIMGSQIAFAYIGVMLAPPMVSFISGVFGIKVYPLLLAVLYVVMVITIKCFINRLKKQGKYSKDV